MAEDTLHDATGARDGKKPRNLLVAIVLLVVLAGAAWAVRAKRPGVFGGTTPIASASAERITPVSVAKVERRDVPVDLEGLGTAVAYATVQVRSQVDGPITQVLFREGQKVKKGDVLVQIDPRPFTIQLHTAEANLARDAAQLSNAKLNLERYTKLREQNLVADQQVTDQRALVAQYDAAIQADRAQVESARLNLDYARIKSPIDGVTGVRLVDPGNLVHANDPTGIVVVTQIDPIAVLFTLPEDDLARVAEQMKKGKVAVDAFARDGVTKLASGEVALIDNQINQQTATIRLKAIFPNPDEALWPNLFVKARLHLETEQGALVVPSTAIQRGPQGTFVYVMGPDQRVSPRNVTVTLVQGETSIVSTGLEVGETVVVEGQNQLRPGAKIAPQRPGEREPKSASPAPSGSWAPKKEPASPVVPDDGKPGSAPSSGKPLGAPPRRP